LVLEIFLEIFGGSGGAMGEKEILNDDEAYLIASNKMKTPATRGETLRGGAYSR